MFYSFYAANKALNKEKVMNISETKVVDSAGLGEAVSLPLDAKETSINIPTEKHIESELKEETGSTQISDSNSSSPIAKNTVSAEISNTESQRSIVANFDNPKPLDPASFPDQSRSGLYQLVSTIANLVHLLKCYNILVRYNVIRKKLYIVIPGITGTIDNLDNIAL